MIHRNKLPKLKLLLEILQDPDRKPVSAILKDLFLLTVYFLKVPRHYFSRYLFKKGTLNIKDYFPDDFLYHGIKPILNNKEWREVLENKLFFQLYFGQFEIALPKMLMYNHKSTFISDGKHTQITNYEDFVILITELFGALPALDSLIVKKAYWSYGGDKVYKLYRSQVNNHSPLLAELYSEVIKSGFLFQETLIQHEALNKLNPFSLNTIRFDTFIDKEGQAHIISGYIRMSINRNHVDNISSGGCQVGIDLRTGKLKKVGYSTLGYYGAKVLESHPITGTIFENFGIPCFDNAKALVLEAAPLIPGLRIVGWDVAIGESGPVLIEGNSDYGMVGNDLSEGGYRTNPVFRKVMEEIKTLNASGCYQRLIVRALNEYS